ncbi:hypothetical protein [Pelagibacterium sp. H642]|uniref:hypothetical protein n=1 Tax=Pelagibacterium sp. H642 TaxID=1881069 RepID=UPI002816283E|nr:hypothetical protein [Pelagibacterium sp. H642]WMT92882.1 hypothetical protein NO934_19080 [Pelagibacterium sp. H642]
MTVDNSGTLNGLSITGVADSFVVNSGFINNTFSVLNGSTFSFENRAGSINTTLDVSVSDQIAIINRQDAALNQLNLQAPNTTIDNSGVFNSPILFTLDGANNIQNRATGILNGITATGNSADHVHNLGGINGLVSLGDGNDWYVNLGTTGEAGSANTIDLGAGNDTFYIQDGLVTSRVDLGPGDDWAAMLEGRLSSDFHAGTGNDRLNWAGGIIQAGIFMEDGDDTAIFYDLTPANLLTGEIIDGGLGNDNLVWQNTVGGDVYRYDNWELIALTRNSEMRFADWATLTLGDSGTGTGRLTIDSASRVLAGGGTHTVAPLQIRNWCRWKTPD